MRGYATAIEVLPVRTYLASDADQDASVISVTDGTALAVPNAQAVIGGEPYAVESVEFTGTDEPDIITLETALTVTVEAGEPVDILPRVDYVVAEVELDGDQGTVHATVQQDLQGKVATREGAYEGDDRPVVEVEVIDGEHVIVDIDGLGAVDAGALKGAPPAEWGGIVVEAPTTAPAIEANPFAIGAIRVTVTGPLDSALQVGYEVAASLTSPVPEDGTATVGVARGSVFDLARLNGTQIPFDAPTYFKVRAVNTLGTGPWSDEVSATPRQADNEVISALYSYFGTVEANQITTGTLDAVVALLGALNVGDLISVSPPTSASNGSGGFTLSGGIVIKDPASPSGEPLVRLHPLGCTFRGKMEADILTVLQNLIINGDASLSGGSTLTAKAGVPDPVAGPVWSTGPQILTQSWPTSTDVRKGFAWDPTGARWLEFVADTSDRAFFRTVSTAGVAGSLIALPQTRNDPTTEAFYDVRGMGTDGTHVYYLWITDAVSSGYVTYLTKATMAGVFVAQVVVPGSGNHGSVSVSGGQVAVTNATTPYRVSVFDTSLNLTKYADLPAQYIYGVGVGTFDFGSEKVVAYRRSSVNEVQVFTPNWTAHTLAEDTGQKWTIPGPGFSNPGSYLTWDGSNFYTMGMGASESAAAVIRKWSTFRPGASDGTWSAVYQDTNAAGHTATSPFTTSLVPARHYATLTLPAAPSGVTGSDVWVGYAATGNAATKYKRAETLAGRTLTLTAGKQTTGSTTIPAGTTIGGAPAKIKSEATGWEGSGDGTFRVKTPTTDTEAAPKKYVDDKVAAVVMPDWGPWVDISSKYVAGPTSATLEIRRRGKDRMIRMSLTWSWTTFQSRNVVAAAGIDVGDRPSATTFAFAYMEGARPGTAFIRAEGSIAVANMATDTRTTAQSSIVYTVD